MTTEAVIFPQEPIWVAATAARTPVGLCAASTASAVRAGLAAHQEHPFFVDEVGEPATLSYDTMLPPEAPVTARCQELLRSTLVQLSLTVVPQGVLHRVLVVVSLPESGPVPDDAEQIRSLVANCFGAYETAIHLVIEGHAGGAVAFGIAARALESAQAEVAIVAGVDSYCDPETVHALDERGELKSEENRNGFIPGEAAGACLLAGSQFLRNLRLGPKARLRAVSVATEPAPDGSDQVCVGMGLSAAFLSLAPLNEHDGLLISDKICDLNGVRYRSEELTYTILRTQHLVQDTAEITHPADCWGDVGAASIPLYVVLATEAWAKSYASGPRAALWAGSLNGRRGVILLDAPQKEAIP
jgi:3-oxoacyl-[acyl-carrier-protein] synthase-1